MTLPDQERPCRAAATDLARALRQLVNAPLPQDLDPERAFWVACRNARAVLATHGELTGIHDVRYAGWRPS